LFLTGARGGAVLLRSCHCAIRRKVAGSIHDGVAGIFYWVIPSAALWLWGRISL